jgi:hypothetical protein
MKEVGVEQKKSLPSIHEKCFCRCKNFARTTVEDFKPQSLNKEG